MPKSKNKSPDLAIDGGAPVRVLVTGASGFSGSYIARGLAERDHHVVATYRRDLGFATRLKNHRGIDLIQADLAAPLALEGPYDFIIHVACHGRAVVRNRRRRLRSRHNAWPRDRAVANAPSRLARPP